MRDNGYAIEFYQLELSDAEKYSEMMKLRYVMCDYMMLRVVMMWRVIRLLWCVVCILAV